MTSRRPLGLDDPERVRRISDRGERDLPASGHTSQHHTNFRPIPGKVNRLLRTIGKELDTSKATSALDSNKEYVPRHRLAEILTPERVRTIVGQPCFKDYTDKDRLTADICFGPTSCLKLLAVLVGTTRTQDLPRLMKDGIHDKCLPMEPELSPQKRLYCNHHKTFHSTVNSYPRPNDRTEFSRWSYSLNAPYIKYNKERHSHYILRHGDVFPMEVGCKMQRPDVPGANYGGPISTMPQYGGYSEVFKVTINESHYDFGNVGMRHPNKFFALKRLNTHDRTNFNLELTSLLFSMDKASGKRANNHLIQLLATFEVPNPSVQGSTFYLLFDWAEGNLKDFWKANPHLVGERSHSIWISQQFHEICQAVQCVHNEREETLRSTDTSRLARGPPGRVFDVNDLYGRHGDIKPDNFLWFHPVHLSSDLLALSDFGLGRLHTQVSRSNQDPRKLAFTATYIAPEFDLPDGMISRTSDIFSLGCVFLEHVTWYLKGLDSVENAFPIQRSDKDIYGFDADKFFVIRPDGPGGHQRPYLKPKVREWIDGLQKHENCTWYIFQLLEIIRDKMLEPDRNKRIHITPLIKEMDKLRATCERNESFYLKTIAES
ncbi:kinase-like protein [Hypoxylon sp. FL1857]|nr:kinase-like protein [Hypoxylon sp. FL1857]